MSGYLELQGKRALVTGGTKGIGEAVSRGATGRRAPRAHHRTVAARPSCPY